MFSGSMYRGRKGGTRIQYVEKINFNGFEHTIINVPITTNMNTGKNQRTVVMFSKEYHSLDSPAYVLRFDCH